MNDLVTYHPRIQKIVDDLGETKLHRAKHMYFGDVLPTDIADALEIDIDDLGYLCFGLDRTGTHPLSWYRQLGSQPVGSITTYSVIKPYALKQSEMNLVKMINLTTDRMIENMKKNEDEVLSMDDASKAVGMIEKLDKITRLEEGKATEILDIKAGFSLRDIANGKNLEDVDNEAESDDDSIDVEFNPLTNKE